MVCALVHSEKRSINLCFSLCLHMSTAWSMEIICGVWNVLTYAGDRASVCCECGKKTSPGFVI
jgi:hypothetical protein